MKTFAPLLLLAACAGEPARLEARPSARKVEVVPAARTRRPIVTEVVGTVRAVRSATLSPLVGGKVAEIRVRLGSPVRAGDVLVRLEAREIDARLAQARAAETLATDERDRAAALRKEEAISAAQYDAAVSQWRIAQARRVEARTIVGHAVLRAPFDGVVTAKLANVGDTAMPGQALLVVEAPGALRFEARVPESAADPLAIGAPVLVRLDGLGGDLTGTIAEIQPASDDATRTRLAKIDLPSAPGLRPGRFGRLLLATGSSLAVSVPADAVVRHGQLEGVFIVEDDTARLRLVRTGRSADGRLEIASGLDGGERVVLGGAAELVDGEPVEVLR